MPASFRGRAPLSLSWPGLSGPPIPAPATTDGPDKPGHGGKGGTGDLFVFGRRLTSVNTAANTIVISISDSHPVVSPVSARRHPHDRAEPPVERGKVGKTSVQGDIQHRTAGPPQLHRRIVQARAEDELVRRHPDHATKSPQEMIRAHRRIRGQFAELSVCPASASIREHRRDPLLVARAGPASTPPSARSPRPAARSRPPLPTDPHRPRSNQPRLTPAKAQRRQSSYLERGRPNPGNRRRMVSK